MEKLSPKATAMLAAIGNDKKRMDSHDGPIYVCEKCHKEWYKSQVKYDRSLGGNPCYICPDIWCCGDVELKV